MDSSGEGQNSSGLLGPAGVSNGIRIVSREVSSPGAARELPDGATVSIDRLAVTASPFPEDMLMYVEALDRSSGIAVRAVSSRRLATVWWYPGNYRHLESGERVIRDAKVTVTGCAGPISSLSGSHAERCSRARWVTQAFRAYPPRDCWFASPAASARWMRLRDGSLSATGHQDVGGGGACGIRVTPSCLGGVSDRTALNVTGVVSRCTVDGTACSASA